MRQTLLLLHITSVFEPPIWWSGWIRNCPLWREKN